MASTGSHLAKDLSVHQNAEAFAVLDGFNVHPVLLRCSFDFPDDPVAKVIEEICGLAQQTLRVESRSRKQAVFHNSPRLIAGLLPRRRAECCLAKLKSVRRLPGIAACVAAGLGRPCELCLSRSWLKFMRMRLSCQAVCGYYFQIIRMWFSTGTKKPAISGLRLSLVLSALHP